MASIILLATIFAVAHHVDKADRRQRQLAENGPVVELPARDSLQRTSSSVYSQSVYSLPPKYEAEMNGAPRRNKMRQGASRLLAKYNIRSQ